MRILSASMRILSASIEVYKKIKAYFNETKMPPNNESSINGFITSVEQAKQLWNDWSPWTITEDIFELTVTLQYVLSTYCRSLRPFHS